MGIGYGFNYGLSDEQRRAALRAAMLEAGLRMSAGATREGFGAINSGFVSGMDAYRQELARIHQEEEKKREREAEEEIRQERLAVMREEAEDRKRRREAEEGATREHEEEIARRNQALEGVEDEKTREVLRLRVGERDFWKVYDRRTAPPPEKKAKAPITKKFPDNTMRQYDGETGEWRVVGRGAPGRSEEEKAAEKAAKAAKAKTSRAEEEARKEALRREDEYVQTWRDQTRAKLESTGLPQAQTERALPPDLKARRAQFLAEERERARYRLGLEEKPAEAERPAARAAEAAVAGAAASARPSIAPEKLEAEIAGLLQRVPPDKRMAAERELRAAYRAGLWP